MGVMSVGIEFHRKRVLQIYISKRSQGKGVISFSVPKRIKLSTF